MAFVQTLNLSSLLSKARFPSDSDWVLQWKRGEVRVRLCIALGCPFIVVLLSGHSYDGCLSQLFQFKEPLHFSCHVSPRARHYCCWHLGVLSSFGETYISVLLKKIVYIFSNMMCMFECVHSHISVNILWPMVNFLKLFFFHSTAGSRD